MIEKALSINNFDDLLMRCQKNLALINHMFLLTLITLKKEKAPVTKVESFLDYAVSFIGEKNNEIVNKFIKVTVLLQVYALAQKIYLIMEHIIKVHISALIRIKKIFGLKK